MRIMHGLDEEYDYHDMSGLDIIRERTWESWALYSSMNAFERTTYDPHMTCNSNYAVARRRASENIYSGKITATLGAVPRLVIISPQTSSRSCTRVT